MNERYEKHYEMQDARIRIDFITDHGQYHSAHWRHDLEMIYLLNGNARISIDGVSQTLIPGEFVVVDSNRVYELCCEKSFMQIRVRVNREFLEMNAGHLSEEDGRSHSYLYFCSRDELVAEKLEPFLAMCDLFKELTPLYVTEPAGYRLKSEAIILEILFLLVQHFAIPLSISESAERWKDQTRIHDVLDYIERHHSEPISLQMVSDEFGLSREYFSRLFHKRLGLTFTQHLSRVRISHFYYDLTTTDTPIMELLERHGLTNYKHFSRLFKETYGNSPQKIRQLIG